MKGTLQVNGGDVLTLVIGSGGQSGVRVAEAYGGGGRVASAKDGAGGGGGRSAVLLTRATHAILTQSKAG